MGFEAARMRTPAPVLGTRQARPVAPQLQRSCACGGMCSGCRSERSELLARDMQPGDIAALSGAWEELPPVVHEVLSSPGQPMEEGLRTVMESRFGHDFSRVRIHTDEPAARSTDAIGASAYTAGQHVVFAGGKYSPTSPAGAELLAHELVHVVQQSRAGHGAQAAAVGPRATAAEREARSLGADVAAGCPVAGRISEMPEGRLHRQEASEESTLYVPAIQLPTSTRLEPRSSSCDHLLEQRLSSTNRDVRNKIVSECMEGLTGNERSLAIRLLVHADGVTARGIIESLRERRPALIKERSEGAQFFQSWYDPQPAGTGAPLRGLRNTIVGSDLSQMNGLPGESSQYNDKCNADERKLTNEEFVDLSKPVRSCCTSDQIGKIKWALETATAHVGAVLKRMEQPGETVVMEALRKHFRSDSSETFSYVRSSLAIVLDELHFSKHTWLCRMRNWGGENCEKDEQKRPKGGQTVYDGQRILICFDGSHIEPSIVMHEVVHAAGIGVLNKGLVGRSGGYDVEHESYRGSKWPDTYPGKQPLRNADSYPGFVGQVVGISVGW